MEATVVVTRAQRKGSVRSLSLEHLGIITVFYKLRVL
jgi:hypothetical protein